MRIPYLELEEHLGECPERFMECSLGCGVALKINQMERHQEKHCAES